MRLHECLLNSVRRIRSCDERGRPEGDGLMPAHKFLIRGHVATLRFANQLLVVQWSALHLAVSTPVGRMRFPEGTNPPWAVSSS